MKTVEFKIMMDVEDDSVEAIKKLEHHADYLLDLASYPEIKNIYGCKITPIGKKLYMSVGCNACYDGSIDLPEGIDTIEEALRYAKDHINECNMESPIVYTGNDHIVPTSCAIK